jgi:hypothetical protein
MKILSKLMLLALPVLAACGGGSNDETCTTDANLNKTCVAKTSHALPEGIWGGATNTGLSVQTLVLENGQYFSVYTSSAIFTWLVEGIMTAADGTFTDPAAVVFASSGAVQSTAVNGTFLAKTSFSATTPGTLQFNGNYNTVYDTPLTVADVSGSSWNNTVPVMTTVTFNADGSLTGSQGGCTFTGSVKPRATGKHVLDGTLTFTSPACAIGNGVSLPIEATVINGQLTFVGVTPQRTGAFYLSATR